MKKLTFTLGLLTVTLVAYAQAPDRGYVTHQGNKFVWSGSREAFVPNWCIFNYDHTLDQVDNAYIDNFVRQMMNEHGFNGAHVAVFGEWFHIGDPQVHSGDSNPDQRTFDKLKAIIKAVYAAGGSTHLWQWGDDARHQTSKSLSGGIMGSTEKKLLDKIYRELNELPGWTIGYGFDIWEWCNASQLQQWHDYLEAKPDWKHMMVARSAKNQVSQLYNGLDYSSYEMHKPSYNTLVAMLNHLPDKPSSSDDRYRIRDEGRSKDVSAEEMRRLLWSHTMAGGVGGIHGDLKDNDGESGPYPNWEEVKTFFTFWNKNKRFRQEMVRDNALTDQWALRDSTTHYVFYQENTNRVRYTFGGDSKRVVAVNTQAAYQEIDLGVKRAGSYTWNAPISSDWAIAVGDFN